MYSVQYGSIAGGELFGCFLALGLSGCQTIEMEKKDTCAIFAPVVVAVSNPVVARADQPDLGISSCPRLHERPENDVRCPGRRSSARSAPTQNGQKGTSKTSQSHVHLTTRSAHTVSEGLQIGSSSSELWFDCRLYYIIMSYGSI